MINCYGEKEALCSFLMLHGLSLQLTHSRPPSSRALRLMMMVFSFITPAAVLQKDKSESQRQRMLFYICVRCLGYIKVILFCPSQQQRRLAAREIMDSLCVSQYYFASHYCWLNLLPRLQLKFFNELSDSNLCFFSK